MATQKKIDVVEEYAKRFQDAKSIFIADFKGINVAQVTELRRQFRDANVEYRIIKNTLAKRSLANAGIEGLDEHLVGPSAFAYSDTDATAPIKVIQKFNRQNVKSKISLTVKGCLFEGRIFSPEQAEALAMLPSRDELLANLLSTLKAPMSQMVNVLQAGGQKLVGILESIKNQKS
jgi:large subunit ribosomal protein L10